MTPFTQLQKGVAAYLDAEVMPHIDASSWQKVAIGTAMSLAIHRADRYIPILQENSFVKNLGLIDENGAVDVAALVPEIKKNLPKEGMKIDLPMVGSITLHEADVDKLYKYIKQNGE